MNREKTLKIVLPVLIVVAAMVWGRALLPAKKNVIELPLNKHNFKSSISVEELQGRFEVGKGKLNKSPASVRQKKSSYEDWGRNPFMSSLAVSQGPTLDGILWDANKPVAIINGEIAGKGDSVGPYVVVEVRPESVLLNDGEKDVELYLGAGQ